MSWGKQFNRGESFAERVADPAQALRDVREAHGWVTRQLATVVPGSMREYNLDVEKRRLGAIAWELKRRTG